MSMFLSRLAKELRFFDTNGGDFSKGEACMD